MRNVLLCTDGSTFAQTIYQYAAWLGQRLAVGIEILHVTDQGHVQAIQSHDFSGNLGIDAYNMLLDQLVEQEHETAKLNHKRSQIILEAAQQVFLRQGMDEATITLTHDTGCLVDCLHRHETTADLVMLGKRGEAADLGTDHLGTNLERILLASHRPCLVTPSQFRPVRRVLFAYDGSKSGQKALQFLVGNPLFKGLELHLITLARKEIDDAANAYLQTATVTLKSVGRFRPIGHVFRGNPEDVIVEYAANQQMDFLIMGTYGHAHLRHWVIGRTTIQILRRSHLPVLLFR